jgi:hypothetical protein
VKCWTSYFEQVRSGAKAFEARAADRDYRVGDLITLLDFDPRAQTFTGWEITRTITSSLAEGEHPAVSPGHVVFGLSQLPPADFPDVAGRARAS